MSARRSLSRAILLAFFIGLPGSPEAFAAATGKIAPSVPLIAPNVVAAPIATKLAAMSLSPAGTVEPGASAALSPTSPAVALPATAVTARIPVAAAAPVDQEPARAMASLSAAARDAEHAGSRFDGDDDNTTKNFGDAYPILPISKIFFPGVGDIHYEIPTPQIGAIVNRALRTGSRLIIVSGEKGKYNSTGVLVKLVSSEPADGPAASVKMTVLRSVTIANIKEVESATIAEVSYPLTLISDAKQLRSLGLLAKGALRAFAKRTPDIDQDMVEEAQKETSIARMTNLLAQELPLTPDVRLELLNAVSDVKRLEKLIVLMENARKPQGPASGSSPAPVGDSLASAAALAAKMKAIGMPDDLQKRAIAELKKIEKMGESDSEVHKTRTYLTWLLELPWSRRTEDIENILQAQKILDRNLDGLDEAKERILEFLAVRSITKSKKGAIIALTGPPGVGKTTIARAIAQALGRKFVRLSLGGVSDEKVLRGHGRTYVGSMPGEIIRQMKAAGTINPVFLLDEIDKLGKHGESDPSAALLEILDPEQHDTFRDRYLDVEYNLSEVLWVVTGNELRNIPEPVRDRMEIIEIDGYTTRHKSRIAAKHLVPQELAEAGLTPEDATLTPAAILRIIEGYTHEAGVRKLRQRIAKVARKISAWRKTRGEAAPGTVDEQDIAKYLGIERYSLSQTAQNGVGVATGLAVGSYDGDTMNVEVSHAPGSGQVIVRQEFGPAIADSAKNAYKHVKAHKAEYGLQDLDLTKIDVDLNFTPSGLIDGPSAGGLMVTAIVSALSGRPVMPGLAMTGEITMRGDILSIGGLKQKVIAAHRMGYKEVIFPFDNLKDVEGIPAEIREDKQFTLTPVKTYAEIHARAFAPGGGTLHNPEKTFTGPDGDLYRLDGIGFNAPFVKVSDKP